MGDGVLVVLADPYVPRHRRLVLLIAFLMPLVLAGPVVTTVWRIHPGAATVGLRALWLVMPAFWTSTIVRAIAGRQREGLPADDQTRLLFRVAMLIPVLGYVPMLWIL